VHKRAAADAVHTRATCLTITAKLKTVGCINNTSTTTTSAANSSNTAAAVVVPQYVLEQIFDLTGHIQADKVCSVIGTLYPASSASSSTTSSSITCVCQQ
jgi:hypothetical protein